MLAKGREKSLLRRHPWVFSGAVARMEGKASLGETIDREHKKYWGSVSYAAIAGPFPSL